METETVMVHYDPPLGSCKCNCGTNIEPRICEHDFSGWEEGEWAGGGSYGTTVCVKCGMTAMSHDMRCGP
jgi:hypothetical protein